MKQRHQATIIQPMYPVWIVDYGDKIEKDLMKDWLRPVIGTDVVPTEITYMDTEDIQIRYCTLGLLRYIYSTYIYCI